MGKRFCNDANALPLAEIPRKQIREIKIRQWASADSDWSIIHFT